MKRHVTRTWIVGSIAALLSAGLATPVVASATGSALATGALVTGPMTRCESADLPSGTYRLTARHSAKVLDVSGRQTRDGAPVIQFENRNQSNQQWNLRSTDRGFSRLTARHSGKALHVGGTRAAAPVQQQAYRGGAAQQWCVSRNASGFYTLLARHSGMALDVRGGSTADRAQVQQWTPSGSAAQQWRLTRMGGSSSPLPPRPACTLATPARGIPQPFGMFTVLSKNTARPDFCRIAKWYSESPGRQVFRLYAGDDFADNVPGGRSHARTEVNGPSFVPDGRWHTFEARMRPSRKTGESYTIAQIFAGCCDIEPGPQARIEVRSDGRIHLGSRSHGNFRISDDRDYANNRATFKLRLRTNGDRFEVYFNGTRKFAGRMDEAKKGTPRVRYHFRWGVYSKPPNVDMMNTVTEIVRN